MSASAFKIPSQKRLRARVKAVYTIGAAAEKIEGQIAGVVPITRSGTLEAAVSQAAGQAVTGDVILLAPACSSFDQFENYREGPSGSGYMAKRVGVDKWLFGVTVLLTFIGLLMIFSASAVMAEDRYGSPYKFVSQQVGWALLGLVTMTLLMRIDYRKFNRPIVVFPAVAVTTLLLLGVFLLRDSHNTHRWIRMGALSLQPSELAKLAMVLYAKVPDGAWIALRHVGHGTSR